MRNEKYRITKGEIIEYPIQVVIDKISWEQIQKQIEK
nr:MAG TPA: hypothetical protein [Caudoviricetes sp.]